MKEWEEQAKKEYDVLQKTDYQDIAEHIMVVAAADNSNRLTNCSNYGDTVTIVAPGKDILSTIRNNKYDYMSGTSMAALTSCLSSSLKKRPTCAARY